MTWLVGAHKFLTGEIHQPSELKFSDYPNISWNGSHILNGHYTGNYSEVPDIDNIVIGTFAPKENLNLFLSEAYNYFTEDIYFDWISSFARYPYLEEEMLDIPNIFIAKYIDK